jgi:hypothetical protein
VDTSVAAGALIISAALFSAIDPAREDCSGLECVVIKPAGSAENDMYRAGGTLWAGVAIVEGVAAIMGWREYSRCTESHHGNVAASQSFMPNPDRSPPAREAPANRRSPSSLFTVRW